MPHIQSSNALELGTLLCMGGLRLASLLNIYELSLTGPFSLASATRRNSLWRWIYSFASMVALEVVGWQALQGVGLSFMTSIPSSIPRSHGFQSFSETSHWNFQIPLYPLFRLGSCLRLAISSQHLDIKCPDLVRILIVLMVRFIKH